MEFGSPVFQIRCYGSLPPRRMLDNKQIVETLLRYFPVEIDKLSSDGRKLIQDAHDFVETARLMLQEKNAGSLFQNFVWYTREVDVSGEEGSG